jgi:translation initiation factor IF-2
MSKKRVHEIARELKENHGIELDNKAVVTELVSLGYDVKSHSSSLEDDQAVAAVQKIVDKRKPKAAPPPVAPKGFVVRRKVGEHVQQTAMPAGVTHAPRASEHEHAAPHESAPAHVPEAHASTPTPLPAPEQAHVAAPPAPSAPRLPVAAPLEVPPAVVAAAAPPSAPRVAVAAQVAPPEPVAPAAAVAEVAPLPPVVEPVAAVVAAPAAVVAAPLPPVPELPPAPPVPTLPPPRRVMDLRQMPGAIVSQVQQPQNRPAPQAPSNYVTGNRPGGHAPSGVRPGGVVSSRPSAPRPGVTVRPALNVPGAPAAAGATAPAKPTMPTATQAVIVSRPLIAVKRVTPTQTNRSYPMAPGRKAIGTGLREIKVLPNQFGTGTKEFVDVSKVREKERPRGRTGRAANEKEGQTTTDIKALIFGRVAIPIRGKKRKPTKKGMKTLVTEMAEDKKVIKVQDGITVSELSQRMGVKTTDLIKKLMKGGKMVTATQSIDPETAAILATDYGWSVKKVGFEVEDFLPKVSENAEDFITRPPVVTVMGHVDHGKTSLLDAIRSANVAGGEEGGITQHIGAYTVKSKLGDITFLDTPGHEAFSAMRSRGANITDVVVLVVAADDGVMPQTKEAIQHAQKAEVPIVVAINKMDVPGANPDRVKKELADNNLLAEDWGGEVIMVPVSAKTRQGLDLLLENIALQSEVLELKANPTRPAQGTVLEARLEKGRGPIATVLVQEGTLRKGDAVVTGIHYGRVRILLNDRGETIDEVKPGYSAEVIGLSGVPSAGDVIHVVADEKAAKQIADHRILKARQAEAGKTSRETLEDLLGKAKQAEQKDLKIVLKADVAGSLEACADAVNKLATRKVKVTIVQKGVGMMTETDMNNAAAFGARVIGFNSRPESGAEAAAKQLEVKWETFGIIYELLDGVTRMMEDLLEPIRTEKRLGKAEVRNLFNVPKLGVIAGSAVLEGVIKRSSFLRLWRANKQIYQGKIASLRRFKEDVREVGVGFECGIGIEGFSEIQAGDVIESFEIEETRPSLN